jgi:Kef-type K+ transport system membrane component KefB
VAKLFEELVAHYHYPPILGDILAGIILGPSVLDWLTPKTIEELELLKWLGIVSLLFLAGMETKFTEFMHSIKESFLVATGGIIVSYVLGYWAGLMLGLSQPAALFLGATLTATSVGLTVKTLSDLGAIGTSFFSTIIGAAVLDDVGGLIVLGLTVALVSSGTARITDLLIVVGMAITFYLVIVFVLHYGSSYLWRGMKKLGKLEDTPIVYLLALTLVVAWASVKFNLSLVVGAYAAGLAFSEIKGVEEVIHRFSLIPNIFASLFFVLSTAIADIKVIAYHPEYLIFVGLVLAAGFLGKIIGCGLSAKTGKNTWYDSMFIGIGMLPRAEVALVITSLGMTYGVFGKWADAVVSSIVLLIYTTSIVTPILLSIMWRHMGRR